MATLQCSRCGGTRYDTNHRCEKGCGVMTAKDEVQSLRERLEQVEADRDALIDALEDITQAAQQEGLSMCGWSEQVNKAAAAIAGSTTSLARRDARMKAEALDESADAIDRAGADYPQGFLRARATKIRQQAEADQ